MSIRKSLFEGWSIPAYQWEFLRRDIIAGLTVASIAVPQAMAYALIAGIDPQFGIYTAIITTALGSAFGSSSHLINGPTNAISLVVFSAVADLGEGLNDPAKLQAVFLLSVLVGLIQILIALLKLGDLTRYVSEAVIIGFMTGAGVLVGLSQLPPLLGLNQVGSGDQQILVRLWLTLTQDKPPSLTALTIGLATVALIYGLHRLSRRIGFRIPELLVALLLVSVVLWASNWKPEGIVLERRLPEFVVPSLQPKLVRQLSGASLAIALLGLLEAISIAKAFVATTRQPLNYNKQCLAEGIANFGGGLFQCMPGSGSLTRSSINYHAGAATRLSGIFAALAVGATLILFAPLAHYVPRPALAGVLLWTAFRIVDRRRLRFCLNATRFDAGIALATAGVAIFLSVEFSVLIGTFLSFLFFVPRASRLHASELFVTRDRMIRERQPNDPQCTKMALFGIEGDLFFGAAPEFEKILSELTRRTEQGVKIVVLRFKRARNPDMVCLELLLNFLAEMRARNVTVLFCGVRHDFARAIHNLHFETWLPDDHIFLEEAHAGLATLSAVRKAYEILHSDYCATCPKLNNPETTGPQWHYVI